jgi:hypothetical protein
MTGIVAKVGAVITKTQEARTTAAPPTTMPPPMRALALVTTPTLVTILAEARVVETEVDDENTLEDENHSLV